jgi:putative PIN family toxin of toxin-antitoxin system
MRFVADTNVIVSALVFGGLPRRVMELAESRDFELFYSAAIQVEVKRVLGEKFGWTDTKMDDILPRLWKLGSLVVPRNRVHVVREDPDDDRILECAVSAEASFVVSGDRHLLRLRVYRAVSLVTPREFLEICHLHGFC